MKITFDPEIELKTGDFGDAIDLEFHVPASMSASFKQLGIGTAEVLYDIAKSDPDVLAHALHWTLDDVAAANTELEASLLELGRLDLEQLNKDAPTFGMGAGPVFKVKS
jgi:hypothetical protein